MQVRISKTAAKGYQKSPLFVQKQFDRNLVVVAKNPLIGIQLHGELKGMRKIRVGNYRLIYLFDKNAKVITVVAMEPRGGVYK